MPAALTWVVVNLVHPSPYATRYAYTTLAACQHAMQVFALSSQGWTCRSIDVLPAGTVMPVPVSSKAMQDRGRRNAAYSENQPRALIASHVQQPR